MTTIQLPVTLAGQTREVEFTLSLHGRSAFSGMIFTGRIGRGTKTHRMGAQAWAFADRQEARRRGYQPAMIHEVGGQVWAVKLSDVVLNRQAYVTGWVADADPTSQHIMEG